MLAMEKSPLEPGVWKTSFCKATCSPATCSSLEQDEPTPCLCHGEGRRASACPQSPVLGEHGGPALLWTGLLQGKNAWWIPEVEKCLSDMREDRRSGMGTNRTAQPLGWDKPPRLFTTPAPFAGSG